MNLNVLVIGDGAMGTALAILLAGKGASVTIWGAFPEYVREVDSRRENRKFLPGRRIPDAVSYISNEQNPERFWDHYDLAVIAVPTQFIRGVFEKRAEQLNAALIVSVAKGFERETLLRPSEIIKEAIGRDGVVVLSGPSHAEEVAAALPASVVAASDCIDRSRRIREIFNTPMFRVYSGEDVIGVETAAALKNVIAVAAGICDGLGFGDNSKSALITRGLAEMTRLGRALGAERKTFSGLSGIGDLITTCISPLGRNLAFGRRIGRGERCTQILEGMEQAVEGVWTAQSALDIAKSHGIEMPITQQVVNILFEDVPPVEAVRRLMERDLKEEFR
mgnify:CR=1 FL=1